MHLIQIIFILESGWVPVEPKEKNGTTVAKKDDVTTPKTPQDDKVFPEKTAPVSIQKFVFFFYFEENFFFQVFDLY